MYEIKDRKDFTNCDVPVATLLNQEIAKLKEDQILDRAIIDRLRKDNEELTLIINRRQYVQTTIILL